MLVNHKNDRSHGECVCLCVHACGITGYINCSTSHVKSKRQLVSWRLTALFNPTDN